jgi:hypothetical protein
MIFIMHHIALCTPCIALVNGGHLLHMQVDHAEPEMEIQVEHVRWVFGGSQASSGEDTNLALDQGKTRCIPPKSLSFIFDTLFIILFDWLAWERNWVRTRRSVSRRAVDCVGSPFSWEQWLCPTPSVIQERLPSNGSARWNRMPSVRGLAWEAYVLFWSGFPM